MKLKALILTLAIAMTTTTAVYSLTNRVATDRAMSQVCAVSLTQAEPQSCR